MGKGGGAGEKTETGSVWVKKETNPGLVNVEQRASLLYGRLLLTRSPSLGRGLPVEDVAV